MNSRLFSARSFQHGRNARAPFVAREMAPVAFQYAALGSPWAVFIFYPGGTMQLIVLHDRERPFTAIPNCILRDTAAISWKAKGLYAYLYGLPAGWRFRIEDLMARSTDGRDAIKSGLSELEAVGLIERRQTHSDDGKFASQTLVIHVSTVEIPPLAGFPSTENPSTVFPSTVFPSTENPPHIKKDPIKKEITKKDDKDVADHTFSEAVSDGLFEENRFQDFMDRWNGLANLTGVPAVRDVSERRRKVFNRMLKDRFFRENWKPAIEALPTLPWYCGQNKEGWKITADDFLKAGWVARIIERGQASAGTEAETREGDRAGEFSF